MNLENRVFGPRINHHEIDQSGKAILTREQAEVVAKNLEKMKTEMMKALDHETFGSYAEDAVVDGKGCSCAAVRSRADDRFGEFYAFGNIQHLLGEDRDKGRGAMFRVAINGETGLLTIVDWSCEGIFSDQARTVINDAIIKWNQFMIEKCNSKEN